MAFSFTSINSLFPSSKFLNKTTVPALVNLLMTSADSTTPNGKSSFFLATFVNSSISSLFVPKYTKTTSLSFLNFSTSSTLVRVFVAGPVFFLIQLITSDSFLPPVYSMACPLINNFTVGNPWISNLSANFFSTVASTLAKYKFSFLKTVAAFSYSGWNFLQ